MLNRRELMAAIAATGAAAAMPGAASAASRDVIDARVRVAMGKMYAEVPQTRDLSGRARGMLVMPEVLKGGFILGGAYGEGALLLNGPNGYDGAPDGYYSVAAASVGFQAGVQTTSHALFFMTDQALQNFRKADGWEIGADAEVTFPDNGLNLQVNSTLLNRPIIAIVFGQDGLLLGASLEGAKYSRIAR